MSTCPSCGRDPGGQPLCPHCGADLKRRVRLRTFGLIAIAVAVIGLIGLWFFATQLPLARVNIGDIQATSNYAYVQIDGTVTRAPNYNATAQSLTFWVRDATGEIMVSAFRDVIQDLATTDRLPAPGDTIALQGTLRVREAVPSLTLDAATGLTLTRATANVELRDIGSLTAADDLRGVEVRGVVRAVTQPFDGLQLITLRDATGAIDLALPAELSPFVGPLPPIELGQSLDVIGTVTLFETTPQLNLRRAADLTVLRERVAFAKVTAISDVTAALAGHWVRVEGTVEKVDPFSSGVKLTLTHADRSVIVLLWQNVWDELGVDRQPAVGATLSVQGEVSVFRGEVEIVPELPQDTVSIHPVAVTAAPTPTSLPTRAPTAPPTEISATAQVPVTPTLEPTPEPTPTARPAATKAATTEPAITAAVVPINTLTRELLGQTVAVRGRVVETASFSAGFKFVIEDETGRISLTLFGDDYKFVPKRAGLNLGAEIVAEGEVAEYQGVLELQPNAGRDVAIQAAGSSAGVPVTAINQLGKPGQFVAVEGTITEVRPFSSGLNLTVDDGTGTVRVTLFENVLAYVPDAQALVVGAKIRAVGKTDFFGRLQVVPPLGYDVSLK